MSLLQGVARGVACAFFVCIAAASPAIAQSGKAPAAQASARPLIVPYRINAGDEVEIYVWGEERLQRTVRILPDGTFAFPLVGQVVAQGKLPVDLEAMISERLKDSRCRLVERLAAGDQGKRIEIALHRQAGRQVGVRP